MEYFELHGMCVTPLRPDPDAHIVCKLFCYVELLQQLCKHMFASAQSMEVWTCLTVHPSVPYACPQAYIMLAAPDVPLGGGHCLKGGVSFVGNLATSWMVRRADPLSRAGMEGWVSEHTLPLAAGYNPSMPVYTPLLGY